PRGPLALAAVRSARGDYRGAVTMLEALSVALRDKPASDASTQVALDLAEALEKSNERARAVRTLEDARSRAPKDLELTRALGLVYDRDKKPEAAEKLYRELLAQEAADGVVLSALANLLADRKDKLPEAADLAQRALSTDGENPAFLNAMGWVLVQQGRPEE